MSVKSSLKYQTNQRRRISGLVRESVHLFLTYLILFNLIAAPFMEKAEAQSAEAYTPSSNSLEMELKRSLDMLTSRLQSNPEGKATGKIAERVRGSLEVLKERIREDEKKLKDRTLSEDQRKSIGEDVGNRRAWLWGEFQRAHDLGFAILKDPAKPVTIENIIWIEADYTTAPASRVMLDLPEHMKGRLYRATQSAKAAAVSFTTAYGFFTMASMLVTVSELGLHYQRNPLAWEDFVSNLGEPIGMVGFGAFMAVNHPVSNMLRGVMKGDLPKRMIPYIGMTAGSIASSVFHDFASDEDLHKCAKSHVDGRPGLDENACAKAARKWAVHGKIFQYAPALMSMLGSTYVAGVIRGMMSTAGAQAKPAAKWVFSGGQILSKKAMTPEMFAKASRLSAASVAKASVLAQKAARFGALTVGTSIVVAVGDFFLFLYLDSVMAEPIRYGWESMTKGYFDPVAWFDKRGFHSEFWYRPRSSSQKPEIRVLNPFERMAKEAPTGVKQGYFDLFPPNIPKIAAPLDQPIRNAFDVEGTTLWSAHGYFSEMVTRLHSANWQPQSIPNMMSCQPKSSGSLPDPYQMESNAKSAQQLRCEVHARPLDIIQNYATKNEEWRKHLVSRFTMAQQNWLRFINNFLATYTVSQNIMRYIADAKFKESQGGARPDLSEKKLQEVAGLPEAFFSKDRNEERPIKVPTSVGYVTTPGLLDHVVASLACGPSVNSRADQWGSGLRDWWNSYWNGKEFIRTPYGSSFQFVPPNITNQNGAICSNESLLPTMLEQGTVALPQENISVFDGPFKAQISGRAVDYRNLAEYIYDNLDPSLYQPVAGNQQVSSFSDWFKANIKTDVDKVWSHYESIYENLVREEYLPVVADRTFQAGCIRPPKEEGILSRADIQRESARRAGQAPGRKDESEATDGDGILSATRSNRNGDTYRCQEDEWDAKIPNGILLSMENELRVYFKALYSLHVALANPQAGSLPGVSATSNSDVLQIAKITDPSKRDAAARLLGPLALQNDIRKLDQEIQKKREALDRVKARISIEIKSVAQLLKQRDAQIRLFKSEVQAAMKANAALKSMAGELLILSRQDQSIGLEMKDLFKTQSGSSAEEEGQKLPSQVAELLKNRTETLGKVSVKLSSSKLKPATVSRLEQQRRTIAGIDEKILGIYQASLDVTTLPKILEAIEQEKAKKVSSLTLLSKPIRQSVTGPTVVRAEFLNLVNPILNQLREIRTGDLKACESKDALDAFLEDPCNDPLKTWVESSKRALESLESLLNTRMDQLLIPRNDARRVMLGALLERTQSTVAGIESIRATLQALKIDGAKPQSSVKKVNGTGALNAIMRGAGQ